MKKIVSPFLFTGPLLIATGESQTVNFDIDAADLSSFDTNRESWVAETGTYSIKVGASSKNIKQTATFDLANEIVTEKDNKVLVPQTEINEMKSQKKAF